MLIPADALEFRFGATIVTTARTGTTTAQQRFGHLQGLALDVSVSRSSSGSVPVVAVSGEVDVYSAPALKESLTGLLQSGDSSVVVDLTNVAFLDSTGLGALVEARAATSEAGGVLPLVCNQERILKLFTITGLDGVFAIHSTLAEAVQAAAV
jgi:anti-sigma B factor antagonist